MIFLKTQDGGGFSEEVLKKHFFKALKALGKRERILLIAPKTRGEEQLATWANEYYEGVNTTLLPIQGVCSPEELAFPPEQFIDPYWEEEVVSLGTVEAPIITELSGGHLSFSWRAMVNKLLVTGGFDLILSFSPVKPNDFTGFSGPLDNILLRSGGAAGVNKYRYLGALYGQENIIGRKDNPVQSLLKYAYDKFLEDLPIVFVNTVYTKEGEASGLYVGDDEESFNEACEWSKKSNFTLLDAPVERVVVTLGEEYKTLWHATEAITHTREALERGGELIIVAPHIERLCYNRAREGIVKKYGYCGREVLIKEVAQNDDLKENLAVAAHLINGSSEDLFSIRICGSRLSRSAIEGVGFLYGELQEFDAPLKISHVTHGLWGTKEWFKER
ncbi:MAG: hypothetical protein ACOXZ2_08600 [Sphaerochaetaceae bacterium]|nr:hypothetical protein [Sphaerochaetaceae bacterium]HHU88030.1 D-mannonate epimerase [Spirochaetales bacterium]